MTFGRWLLIHSFSIFLVGLMLFGYIYRHELRLEQVYQQLLKLEPQENTTTQSITASEGKTKEKIPAKPDTANSAAVLQQSSPQNDQKLASTLPLTSIPTVSKEIIQQDDRLMSARKAYWDKNYNDAIHLYQQLVKEHNDNPDYLGELGNIYYAINDYQNATRAYYRAALLLLEQKKPEKAQALISPITAMDRDLGNQLKEKISIFYRSEK